MTAYFWHLTLDVSQETMNLQYLVNKTVSRADSLSVMERTGRWAGCYHFEQGDTITAVVHIEDKGVHTPTLRAVNSLHFVFLPKFPRSVADLSPLRTEDAVVELSVPIPKSGPWISETESIASQLGGWSAMGFLSISRAIEADGGVIFDMPSVYRFDPEVIVGTGEEP